MGKKRLSSRWRWSIRSQLLALVLTMALPLILLLLASLYDQSEVRTQSARTVSHTLAQLSAATAAQFLEDSEVLVAEIAKRPAVRSLDPARCDPLFAADFPTFYPRFSDLTLMNRGGEVICTISPSAVATMAESRVSATEAMTRGELVIGPPVPHPSTGEWVAVLAYPLSQDGEAVGTLLASLELARLQAILDQPELSSDTTITLINGEGHILARSLVPEQWVGQNVRGSQIVEQVLVNEGEALNVLGPDGIERVWEVEEVPGTNWHAYAGVPTEAIFAPVRSAVYRNLALVGANVVLAALVALALSRAIVQPIHQLADAASRVARGELAVQAPVAGPAELRDVARQFNEMVRARQLAEAALASSEERFGKVFRASPVAIAVSTVEEGRFVDANDAFLQLSGYGRSDLIGKRIHDLHLWCNEAEGVQLIAQLRAMRRVANQEQRLCDRSGEIRHVLMSAELIEVGGEPAILTLVHDVTERKRAEAQQARQAQQLRSLTDASLRINSIRSLRELLRVVLEQARLIIGADQAQVTLLAGLSGIQDSTAKRFRDDAGAELMHPQWDDVEPEGVTYVSSPALTMIAEEDNVPIPQPDNGEGSGLSSRWSERLAVPLMERDGQRLGLIELFNDDNCEFTSHDEAILTQLAQMSAIAIENVRLYEQVRASRGQLQVLSRQLLEVQEKERRLLARELHDEIGQALTAVKVNLQTVERHVGTLEHAPLLAESVSIVDHALQQVRHLSLALRPSLLDDLGLVAALRWYVDRQAQRTGFQSHFLAEIDEARLTEEQKTVCFRITQEALTNITRHAQAKRVWVDLRDQAGTVFLLITDDGEGFNVQEAWAAAARGDSLGLLGMRERVQLSGGELSIDSSSTWGTEIRVQLPLPESDHLLDP